MRKALAVVRLRKLYTVCEEAIFFVVCLGKEKTIRIKNKLATTHLVVGWENDAEDSLDFLSCQRVLGKVMAGEQAS